MFTHAEVNGDKNGKGFLWFLQHPVTHAQHQIINFKEAFSYACKVNYTNKFVNLYYQHSARHGKCVLTTQHDHKLSSTHHVNPLISSHSIKTGSIILRDNVWKALPDSQLILFMSSRNMKKLWKLFIFMLNSINPPPSKNSPQIFFSALTTIFHLLHRCLLFISLTTTRIFYVWSTTKMLC